MDMLASFTPFPFFYLAKSRGENFPVCVAVTWTPFGLVYIIRCSPGWSLSSTRLAVAISIVLVLLGYTLDYIVTHPQYQNFSTEAMFRFRDSPAPHLTLTQPYANIKTTLAVGMGL